eukprot:g30117.t1
MAWKVDIEAEAEMILKAEQELVELRWSLQRARSEAEQQVDDLMKEVKTNQEALAKTEPELAKEIKETAEKIKEVKAEKAAEEAAAKEHEAAVAAGRAKEEEERQVAVADFLKKYGFKSVNSPKRSLLWSSYALHKAAKQGDARTKVDRGRKSCRTPVAKHLRKLQKLENIQLCCVCLMMARVPVLMVGHEPWPELRLATRKRTDVSPIMRRRPNEIAKVVGTDGRIRLRGPWATSERVASVSDIRRYCTDIDPYSRKSWAVREAFKSMRTEEQNRTAAQTWSALKSWQASEKPLDEWYAGVKCR